MARLGFTHYDTPPAPAVPTIAEALSSLAGGQKVAILDGFTEEVRPSIFRQWLKARNAANQAIMDAEGYSGPQLPIVNTKIPTRVLLVLYKAIDDIEEKSKSLMRGEVVVQDEIVNPDTGEVTPAVYNTPPTSQAQLRTAIAAEFTEAFSAGEVTAVLNRMIQQSKTDGSGTWSFYRTEVIK